jgi:hypothetical protein
MNYLYPKSIEDAERPAEKCGWEALPGKKVFLPREITAIVRSVV